MKKAVLSLACVLLFSTQAQAAKFSVDFAPSQNQAHRMIDGTPAVDSAKPGSKIRLVAPEEPVKKRGSVQLLVFNGSAAPFDVGSESVTAELSDRTPVAIISTQELAHEERMRETRRRIAGALSAMGRGMSTYGSGWSNSTVNYNANTFGTYGSSYTTGTASVSTYSPAQAEAARSLANLENQQTFDRMNYANAAGKAALQAFLNTSTVDPGNMAGGLITFELPPAARGAKEPVMVTFHVRAGADEHDVVAIFTPR